MYFPDLSVRSNEANSIYLVLNIGWLDTNNEYPQGDVPKEFLERLWIYCEVGSPYTLGYHECSFCLSCPTFAYHGENKLRMGSGQIRVFGQNKRVYAAPNLIYHYVVEHHYCPPVEFIEAVIANPLPGSPQYAQQITQYGWLPLGK